MSLMVSAGTLIIGFIIGYLAQRSKFCTIGGIRNFYLARDMYLLKGVLVLVATASIGYLFTHAAGGPAMDFPAFTTGFTGTFDTIYSSCINPAGQGHESPVMGVVLLTLTGGLGVGLFSVMADGCPLRHHVRASEGDSGSLAYVAGFYLAALLFGLLVQPVIASVL